MSEKEFIFEKTVYFGDTNIYGNAYFVRYFDWQGDAREEFFKQLIGDYNKFMQSGIKIFTLEASVKYHYEVKLFDKIIIKLKPNNIKKITLDLLFIYFNKTTNKLVAEGKEKIGFIDSVGKITPIPKELIEGWDKFKAK